MIGMTNLIDTSQILVPLRMAAPYGSLNNERLQLSLRQLIDDPIIQGMAVDVHLGARKDAWRLSEYPDESWDSTHRRNCWSKSTYGYYYNAGGTHAITGGGPMIAIEIILQHLERETLDDLRYPHLPI